MKVLKSDYGKGYVRINVDRDSDLWHISHVITPGDLVKGRTTRKIDKGGKDDRSKSVQRISVILKIEASKVEFDKNFGSLRVLGKVVEGPADIANGSHHSLAIEEGSMVDIQKKRFLQYQIKHLEQAAKNNNQHVLICAVDRGEGSFALLRDYGYDFLGSVEGEVEKQDKRVKSVDDFYVVIKKHLEDFDKKHSFQRIVIGSPAFWKDELYKKIGTDLQKKVVLVNCNSGGESGINEILKRDELKKILKEEKVQEEISLVEAILSEIGKDGKVVYGYVECKKATEVGAVEKLIVSSGLIKTLLDENNFGNLDYLMRMVEKINGEVHVVSADHEGGAKLDGLGGIASLLRYKLE
jgi:protein pelota